MSHLPVPIDSKSEGSNVPVVQKEASRALAPAGKTQNGLRSVAIRYRLLRRRIAYYKQRLSPLAYAGALRYRLLRKLTKQHWTHLKHRIPSKDEMILFFAVARQVTPRVARQAWDVSSTAVRQFYHEWRQSLEKQDERAFMPAALEIIDTAASPTGRKLMHFIMVIVATFALWSWFGEVDIVAVAPGKIIPQGRTQVIQSLEAGTVRMIAVRDGQRVTAGQLLIELDDTALLAELSRSRQERIQSSLDIARLQSILDPEKEDVLFASIDAPADDVKLVLFHMKSQRLEHAASLR